MTSASKNRSNDNTKQQASKSIDSKFGPPKMKTIDPSKKSFSPNKTASNNAVDVYVSGMTHGIVVMRTERANKKNIEGFVQPLKNKCTNEPDFARTLDIVKVRKK